MMFLICKLDTVSYFLQRGNALLFYSNYILSYKNTNKRTYLRSTRRVCLSVPLFQLHRYDDYVSNRIIYFDA